MQMKQEPGENGLMPHSVAKQAVKQRRNVRDLNTRLEMYVRSQQDTRQQVTRLKELKAKQEQEFKHKLEQTTQMYEETCAALRKERESLAFESAQSAERLSAALEARKESEAKMLLAESKQAELAALAESLRIEHERNAKQLDAVRSEYASLRYKYESYSVERAQLDLDRVAQQKASERLKRDVAAKEEAMSAERESLHKLVADKDAESSHLREEMAAHDIAMTSQQVRLRQELELKLSAFVEKREEQYKQEKAEWMGSYKSANAELKCSNGKLSDEIAELRTRLAKLKAQKSELEVALRESEEEQERMRTEVDERRRRAADELKGLKLDNLELRDALKAKSIELEELAVMKMQLDSEIELYRNILNEAEQCAGYKSPFHSVQKGNGSRNSRKRKRFNHQEVELENHHLDAQLKQEEDMASHNKVRTPGVARATKMAHNDVAEALQSPFSEMGMGQLDPVSELEARDRELDHIECKDREESGLGMTHDERSELYSTPGNVEGATLQFSGLNLNEGMIEIQNTGEAPIQLGGYTLSNAAGTAQYELPHKMELCSKEKLRIYVGEQMFAAMQAEEEKDDGSLYDIVGEYDGAYVFWGKDVWTGHEDDCARLYNPRQEEVALIEISPEMVDETAVKEGCLVM